MCWTGPPVSVNIGGVRLHVGVAAAAVSACMVNYGSPQLLLIEIVAVALHEMTHLFVMLYYGCSRPSVEVLPGGIRMRADGFESLGYRQAAVVSLCAPAANLLAGFVFYLFWRRAPAALLRRAFVVHFVLGGVNLLPMSFLDGGRALQTCLASAGHSAAAESLGRGANAVCLSGIGVLLLFLAFRRIFTVPLWVFFLYCLAASAAARKKNIDFFEKEEYDKPVIMPKEIL